MVILCIFRTRPMQGVERLSIVSKVLFDSRLIELRRENEALKLEQKRKIDAVKLKQKHTIDALKLKVFWLEHNDMQLKEILAWANTSYGGPKCYCERCYWAGRFGFSPDQRILPNVNCSFIPWFENEIVDFDMTSSVSHYNDITTHFAIDPNGDCNFSLWLLQIPTCEHPELRKVYDLFVHLAAWADIDERPVWESYWA